MNKKWLPLIALLFFAVTASSQTLFTYGKYSVTAAEFKRAYDKNNKPVADKAKSIRNYLDLYISSRLKIREAYERGYDTLPQIKTEVANLRNQIIENYLTDPEIMDKLLKEAFQRSQKDIQVAHIFITAAGDTTSAFRQVTDIINRLNAKEDFGKLAEQFSQDPAAKTNKGNIGWITAFTLPYIFENAVYPLKPGQHSGIIRSKTGYHIFKNLGERKAVGKMKAKQILLAFPPGIDDAGKRSIAQKADSIYRRVQAGEDFDKLAQTLSNDYVTAITGGTMPDFGVGQYDPEFEKNAWALARNGAVTKPFQTSHGYHIVKRISVIPVVSNPADKNYENELKFRINQDQRWQLSREVTFNRVVKQAPLSKNNYDDKVLWALSDSLLDRRSLGIGKGLSPESVLFKLGDNSIRVSNWIDYARTGRFKKDGSGLKSYPDLWNEYLHETVFQYYRDHLEQFNDEFRYQMSEFTDGNLFFEIMQQEIWNKAGQDSAQLLALYEKNKAKYDWKQSADAVVFFCADNDIAKTLHEQLKKIPSGWKSYADALAEKVVADSARFEWAQIPNLNKMLPRPGMLTTPLLNASDNTASFAYIIKVYPQSTPRSFTEAKGLVINDYQAILEAEWTKELRKKYPVVVDEKVLADISK